MRNSKLQFFQNAKNSRNGTKSKIYKLIQLDTDRVPKQMTSKQSALQIVAEFPVLSPINLSNPSGSLVEIYIVFMEQQFTPHGLHILKQQPSPHTPPRQFSAHAVPKHFLRQNSSKQQPSPSAASWANIRSLIVRRIVLWAQQPPLNVPAGPQHAISKQLHWFNNRTWTQWVSDSFKSQHFTQNMESTVPPKSTQKIGEQIVCP